MDDRTGTGGGAVTPLLQTSVGSGSLAVGGFINSGTNPEVFLPTGSGIEALLPSTSHVQWSVGSGQSFGGVAIVPGAVFYSTSTSFYVYATSNGAQLFQSPAFSQVINGGISVAEGFALVPFGTRSGGAGSGTSTAGGIEAFGPLNPVPDLPFGGYGLLGATVVAILAYVFIRVSRSRRLMLQERKVVTA
jgi:hypothetical protein